MREFHQSWENWVNDTLWVVIPMLNLKKIDFCFWLKMHFRYSKINYESLVPKNFFIFNVTAFQVERSREQGWRKANFERIFLNTEFFNLTSSRIRTIFIRSICNFNGICKTKLSTVFFNMLKIVRVIRHFSRFFYGKKYIFFKRYHFLQKSVFLKMATYFVKYFNIENKDIGYFVPDWKHRHLYC